MKCRNALGFLGALSSILISLASTNEAQAGGYISRATCASARDGASMGARMGSRNANRLVTAAWARLGRSCDQIDRLATIIADTPLARPAQGGLFAGCFYMGYTDGLWDELERIYDSCGVACFNAGAEIGNISAQGYCAASIAVGGLYDPGFIRQPPLPFCGQNLAIGCKSEYVSVATYEFPACYNYTVGAFEETFENSVRQDCFVPADVPIIERGRRISYFDREEGAL